MLRRLFTFLSVVSLLLCVAACVLWVRSYSVSELWLRYVDRAGFVIQSDQGRITFRRLEGVPFFDNEGWRWGSTSGSISPRQGRGLMGPVGFGSDHRQERIAPGGMSNLTFDDFTPVRVSEWWFPHWSVAAAAALPFLLTAGAAMRRRKRQRIGLCPSCGYDLRASPEQCPECGAVSAKATPSL